ncbi:MAG: Mth938-like domain-containing protein [Acetobacterales bacterium]
MADVTPLVPPGRKAIQGYGDGGFLIDGETVGGSILLFDQDVLPWTAGSFEEISLDSLQPLLDRLDSGILVLGCGERVRLVSPELRGALRERGLVMEAMDTGAACRTYNVLVAEERRVAAALVAV